MHSGLHRGKTMAKIEVKLKKTLPDSEIYEGVEYIESTGTQYIILNNEVDYNLINRHIKFAPRLTSSSDSGNLFSISLYPFTSLSHDLLRLFDVQTDTETIQCALEGHLWSDTSYAFYPSNPIPSYEINQIIQLEIGAYGAFRRIDSDLAIELTDSFNRKQRTAIGTVSHLNSLFVGVDSNGNLDTNTCIKARLYEYKYGSILNWVSHLIPCVRKSDQKPGLYDNIKKVFYMNQGTGEFLIGNKTGIEYSDDEIILDKFNGLKSVSSLSQSNGDAGEVYYGIIPSSGSIEAVDNNGNIAQMIKDGTLPNANVNIDICVNDNTIQKHISSDSDYTVLDKKFKVQLSNTMDKFDIVQYNGYSYKGQSATAYDMLVSVLKSYGFDETTEIPQMLEEVAGHLKSIVITRPFLEKGTYRETINKFCELAQMQVYQTDNGLIKFVSARPAELSEQPRIMKNIIEVPSSKQLSQLNKALILKNKITAVEITPSQLLISGDSPITENVSPADKTLNDVMNTFVNNSSATMVAVSDYYSGVVPIYDQGATNNYDIQSGARIELYYSEGTISVPKPESGQYRSFKIDTELSGKQYGSFVWRNQWSGSAVWTSSSIQSDTLYSQASVISGDSTWADTNIGGAMQILVLDHTANYGEQTLGQVISIPTYNQYSISESGDQYIITYKIPTGYFFAEGNRDRLANTSNSWDYYYRSPFIRQADVLKITITADYLHKVDGDTITVGLGDNIYQYSNNELLAISENETLEQSQYYKNAQNIIKDYSNGVNTGKIKIVGDNYYNIVTGDIAKNWDKGEIINIGDAILLGGDLYKVTSREFKHSGVPKIDIELEEVKTGGFVHLNFTGLDSNGNMEGQQAFDGNIVAYAAGKPTITSSGGTETITYPFCNGFNSEYYNGYDLSEYWDSIPDLSAKVVEDTIFVPPTFNGKPVIKILDNAFFGYHQGYGQDDDIVAQGAFVKNIILGGNLQSLGRSAIEGIGRYYYYNASPSYTPTVYIPKNTNTCQSNSVSHLKVYVQSDIQASSGAFDNCKVVVFEETVTAISGAIFYNHIGNKMVFKHPEDAYINLNISSMKSAGSITIYSDNSYVNYYDWASKNITATIRPLSEWVEE